MTRTNLFRRCWQALRHFDNAKYKTAPDEEFAIALLVASTLAVHWQVIDFEGDARFVNWCFEANRPVGDPGLITIDRDARPGLSFHGCSFSGCDLNVIETILEMVLEAQS